MFDEMGLQLGSYIRSVIINMIAIGTITSIALWIIVAITSLYFIHIGWISL